VLVREFRVERFKNILDSTAVEIQPDVTCLVGKNESGKTALLHALYRMNPAYRADFNSQDHYPRWLLTQARRAGSINKTEPINVVFDLSGDDVAAVEAVFGADVLRTKRFTYGRRYDGSTSAAVEIDDPKVVLRLLEGLEVDKRTYTALRLTSFDGLPAAIDNQRNELDNSELPEDDRDLLLSDLANIEQKHQQILGESDSLWQAVVALIRSRMPKFFYFGEYSLMPGRIDLDELDSDNEGPGQSSLQTVRALLRLAQTDTASLRDEEYEERKAELEAVSNDLTQQVFEYWSQNQELQVEIDVDKVTVPRPTQYGQSQTAVAKYLDVRVKDRRHGFTSNFGLRSSGFQWFFSFLAAFSEFEGREGGVVVLLDEPAMALHAKAQADFLRFINERLAPSAQVIYTTHSPFMVEMGRLERVRVVEDKGPKTGAVVSSEVLAVGADTLFPLQAALGYDIAQSLFVGEANLLVEGTSDFTYLTVLSDFLASQGRTGLDARWRVLPAGGAANVPAFVALIGPALDVTVLVDSGTQGMQRLSNLATQGLLDAKRLLTVGHVTGKKQADIEDVFSEGDYLLLYNGAFSTSLKVKDLATGDRMVGRISRTIGSDFTDHGKPADYLLRNRDHVLPKLSGGTLDRFEQLIVAINGTI
jgi:predicted ATPase